VSSIASAESDANKLHSYLDSVHSLCPSEDAFNSSSHGRKQRHSDALTVLLCIVHALPRASRCQNLLNQIYNPHDILPTRWMSWNFHRYWTVSGRNDDIIQSARDAVFQYYKVCVLK